MRRSTAAKRLQLATVPEQRRALKSQPRPPWKKAAAKIRHCGERAQLTVYSDGSCRVKPLFSPAFAYYPCGSGKHCPLCAKAKTVQKLARLFPWIEQQMACGRQVMGLTLTVPHGLEEPLSDVLDRLQTLKKGLLRLWRHHRGGRVSSWTPPAGGHWSIEVKRGADGGWHPHLHAVAAWDRTHQGPPFRFEAAHAAIRSIDSEATQAHFAWLKGPLDVVEYAKYHVKHPGHDAAESGIDQVDRSSDFDEVWPALRRKHMVGSIGNFRGFKSFNPFKVPSEIFELKWTGNDYEIFASFPLAQVV